MSRLQRSLTFGSYQILVVPQFKRFSYDRLARTHTHRYWRDKLDVLVDFPVNGLDLSGLVHCPDSPGAIYDLYAVSNHFGGMGGGHCELTPLINHLYKALSFKFAVVLCIRTHMTVM